MTGPDLIAKLSQCVADACKNPPEWTGKQLTAWELTEIHAKIETLLFHEWQAANRREKTS